MFRRLVIASVAVCALAAGTAGPSMAVGFPQGQIVSADPVDYTPHVKDGSVFALATVGNTVYVGGTFSTVVNAGQSLRQTRNFLYAFDRDTGRILDSFVPVLNGAVETIAPAPDGVSIIIGGRFNTVQGVRQRSLAMLAPDGTRVTSFEAKTTGYVNKLVVRGDRLIAGGRFSSANGIARSNLAAFSATSGALDSNFDIPVTEGRTKSNGTVTNPAINELDVTADGSRLVVVGNFRKVGADKRMQVAMIDLTTNTVTRWSTNRYPNDLVGTALSFQCYQSFETQMRDVEFSPDGSYFVLATTGGAPDRNVKSLCDTAARFDNVVPVKATVEGQSERWRNCTGGDTLYSVAITASGGATGTGAVYLGGHQRWLDNCGGKDTAMAGSFAADGIAAVDASTGKAIRTWNPGRTRGVGAEELLANADGLYIGSDTEELGGEFHGRLGLFPLL